MSVYTARASPDGRFWLVYIVELDQYTQARTVGEIEAMARDLIAIALDVDVDSVQVTVERAA